jgi:hypothetical protein
MINHSQLWPMSTYLKINYSGLNISSAHASVSWLAYACLKHSKPESVITDRTRYNNDICKILALTPLKRSTTLTNLNFSHWFWQQTAIISVKVTKLSVFVIETLCDFWEVEIEYCIDNFTTSEIKLLTYQQIDQESHSGVGNHASYSEDVGIGSRSGGGLRLFIVTTGECWDSTETSYHIRR